MQSERGKNAIERFSHLTSEFIDEWCRTIDFEFFDDFKEQFQVPNVSIDVPKLFRDSISRMKFKDFEEASNHYTGTMIEEGIPFEMADKNGKKEEVAGFPFEEEGEWYDYVAAISLGLYQGQPDYFLPYNFRTKFNQVEEIHATFDIPLQPVPGKSDKSGRCRYYAAINEVWQEFRLRHGLSPIEMCAFLYDFASEFITPMEAADLPSPSKVWLITGGSWDIETSDNATSDTVTRWSGNTAIRRGDILMLYLVSPRKSIDSIWRACTDVLIHSSIIMEQSGFVGPPKLSR
jgi:hypothetical protein